MSVTPPKWAKRIRIMTEADKRADPGAKLLWFELWSYAPLDRSEDHEGVNREPVRVWPKRKTIVRDLGEPLGTIKGWFVKLASVGWVRRVGEGWELAVVEPFKSSMDPLPAGEGSSTGLGIPQRPAGTTSGGGSSTGRDRDPTTSGEGSSTGRGGIPQHPGRDPLPADIEVEEKENGSGNEHEHELEPKESRDPRTIVTSEFVRAIRAVGNGGWDFQLGSSKWECALGEAIPEHKLTPLLVAAILARWDAQFESLDEATRAKVKSGKGFAGIPSPGWIWWDRKWLTETLAALGSGGPGKPADPRIGDLAGHPVRLEDGTWGAKVGGSPKAGDTITVTPRSGESWKAVVSAVVRGDGPVTVVRTRDAATNSTYGTTASLPGIAEHWRSEREEFERKHGPSNWGQPTTPEENDRDAKCIQEALGTTW